MLKTIDDLFSLIKKKKEILNDEEIIDYIHELLYPYFIRISYDKNSHKIILNAHGKADFNLPLVKASNGLILDIKNNNILCRPPSGFTQFSANQLIENLSKYKVYPIYDGTVINLYYSEKWCLGTKNSIDSSKNIWRDCSFENALKDVLESYSFKWENLDTSLTYTIIIKHPAFHPFKQPSIWPGNEKWIKYALLICATNKEGIHSWPDIGIPIISEIKVNKEDLLELNKCTQKYFEKNIEILGYTFRDWNKELPDIMLTSDLMRDIRDLVYQIKEEENEEKFRDINYVALYNFLSIGKTGLFIKLFPQFFSLYKYFKTIMLEICNEVINAIKTDKADNSLIILLSEHVKKEYKIIGYKNPRIDKKNILMILLNHKYIDIYFSLFFPK
ncbi:MAG: hypothetical protein QW303_03205 [Nitrososphaerota archaeon]